MIKPKTRNRGRPRTVGTLGQLEDDWETCGPILKFVQDLVGRDPIARGSTKRAVAAAMKRFDQSRASIYRAIRAARVQAKARAELDATFATARATALAALEQMERTAATARNNWPAIEARVARCYEALHAAGFSTEELGMPAQPPAGEACLGDVLDGMTLKTMEKLTAKLIGLK